jgi:hypothetical protein
MKQLSEPERAAIGIAIIIASCIITILLVLAGSALVGCSNDQTEVVPNSLDAGVDGGSALTWEGANEQLMTAWCQFAQRCDSAGFSFSFPDLPACISFEASVLCYGSWEGWQVCESLYPDKRKPDLAACPTESAAAPCSVWVNPGWTTDCNIASPWSQ